MIFHLHQECPKNDNAILYLPLNDTWFWYWLTKRTFFQSNWYFFMLTYLLIIKKTKVKMHVVLYDVKIWK